MQTIPSKSQATKTITGTRSSDAGQVMVLICLAIVTIMGIVGLVADVGSLQAQKQRMQTAADSAALAAAQELNYGDSASAGKADAASNGFTNGQNGIVVKINNPPLSGPNAGKPGYIEAIVSRPEPTFFLRVLGLTTITLKARAVSAVGDGPNCIYVMNPTASAAMNINGNVNIHSGCGLLVDSNSSTGLSVNGNVTVTAPNIGVVGGYSSNGNVTLTPQPKRGILPAADPLAYVQAPSYGACSHNSFSLNGNNGTSGNPYQMNPGVYCGGISVNGNSYLRFNAGTYVIAGGGMTINGNATMTGAGVTFYNTTGSGGYRAIILNGNIVLTLSAPTSGGLAGILFFQDRSISGGAGSTINGNSGSTIDGALYFPTTTLTYNGNSSVNGYSIVVADKWIANGNSSLGNNYSSLANGSPIKGLVLSE
jgi:Putative Flp pilus-assembly TadE/G-like